MKRIEVRREALGLHKLLITSFVVLSIFPMLVMSIALYHKSEAIIKKNASRYTTQLLMKTNASIDLKLRRFADDASLLLNPNVQRLLKESNEEQLDYLDIKTLREAIYESMSGSPAVTSMAIHRLDGGVLVRNDYPGPSSLPPSVIDAVIRLNGSIYWRYAQDPRASRGESAIQAVRLIKNMTGPEIKPLGILSFTVSERILFGSLEDLDFGADGDVMIVDRQGTILSAQQRGMIGQTVDEDIRTAIAEGKDSAALGRFGGDAFISSDLSEETGMRMVGIVPMNQMTPGLGEVLKSGWLWASLLLAAALLVTYLLTTAVTKPIRQLVKAMQRVERGERHLEVAAFAPREIQFLTLSFNKMTDRLQHLIEDERRAQLKVLESQINPHFLYNTLDTIYWMLYLKGEEEIGGMVVSMTNILRYGIGRSDRTITLKDEIDNIRDYLRIQSMRYGDKMKFDIRVEPAILDAMAIKLMLQPLVENAIKHGIDSGGEIAISAWRAGMEVHIQIRDNGKGMPSAATGAIPGNRHSGSGLGLHNVNERIRFIFGEPYGLTIDSKPGSGTQVKIVLPYRPSQGGEA